MTCPKFVRYLALGLALNFFGCVVGQPAGKGRMMYRTEARTGAGYYLYLPQDYVESEGSRPPDKKWPIVVSFHGMRPWDSAGAQIREWQQEADRYGYVIIAPNTRVSDMLGEIPIRRISSSLKRDEQDTLAILDEISETLDVDPNHVLSTSWSMGGYLAHYMLNRHPDRFSCLAVRQSNFSADILDPKLVPRYRDSKIAIFYTQHDFDICRRESQQAIAWYAQYGFDMTAGIVESMGHERTPQTAAAFFAKTCNAVAKTPPAQLAKIKLSPVPGTKLASLTPARRRIVSGVRNSPSPISLQPARSKHPRSSPSREDMLYGPGVQQASSTRRPLVPEATRTSSRSWLSQPGRTPTGDNSLLGRAARTKPTNNPTRKESATKPPKRRSGNPVNEELNPLSTRLSAHIGISPMLISYTVRMPRQISKGAEVLWIDNGEPISRGISGQITLLEPGQHEISVLVVTKDNREFRDSKTVTVLERLSLGEDGGNG